MNGARPNPTNVHVSIHSEHEAKAVDKKSSLAPRAATGRLQHASSPPHSRPTLSCGKWAVLLSTALMLVTWVLAAGRLVDNDRSSVEPLLETRLVEISASVSREAPVATEQLKKSPGGAHNEDNDNSHSLHSPGALQPTQGDRPQFYQPKGILFVKTPKVGGTSLALILERYAHAMNLTMVEPLKHMAEKTCYRISEEMANEYWRRMFVKHNTGPFQVFLSQACYKPFMRQPKWWYGETRPFVLGLMRDPWERWVSAYRYTQARCQSHDPTLKVEGLCGRGFEDYTKHLCSSVRLTCSAQFEYMHGRIMQDSLRKLQPSSANNILNQFDFVLILERFEESLIVLHKVYGFPFRVLPSLVANKDDQVPVPVKDLRDWAANFGGMGRDALLYKRARKRLQEAIDRIPADEFADAVQRLKDANQRAKQLCHPDRIGNSTDCLTESSRLQKKLGCLHQCLESDAVVYGNTTSVA